MASPPDSVRRRGYEWGNRSTGSSGGYVTLGPVRYGVRRGSSRCPCASARSCCCATAAVLAGCLGRASDPLTSSPATQLSREPTLDRLQRFRFGRERRGNSAEGSRPRPDRAERLRELTERLRGRPPQSQPATAPPVPPPRHRHSGPRSPSSLSPRDSLELTLCCSGPGASPIRIQNQKMKQERIDSKDELKQSENSLDVREDSNSKVGDPHKEDQFDVDSLCRSRLEPRSIFGSYTQKAIPFRSASFSQVDYNSLDGKYSRSAPKSIPFLNSSRIPSTVKEKSLSTICSGSASTVNTTPLDSSRNDERSRTSEGSATEVGSTPSVDSAVGSDEGLVMTVVAQPATSAESVHGGKQPSVRSLTHPLPSRSTNGDMSNTFSTIDSNGMKSLQCIPRKTLTRQLHEVYEESNTSLADSAQAQSETMSPVDGPNKSDCFNCVTRSTNELVNSSINETEPIENLDNYESEITECECSEASIFVESPQGKVKRTAIANVIPVPVYECIVKEWSSSLPADRWLPDIQASPDSNSLHESKDISNEVCTEQSDINLGFDLLQCQDNKEDETITSEQVESLLAAVQNSSPVTAPISKERRKLLDKSKRRKGIYINNADDLLLNLPEPVLNADFCRDCPKFSDNGEIIKSGACETEISIDSNSATPNCANVKTSQQPDWSPTINSSATPTDISNAPIWPKTTVESKWPVRPKLTYQSSDERDDDSSRSNNRKCNLLLRADSLSEGESECGSISTSNRDRTASPSPFNPSDVSDSESIKIANKDRGTHVTRRYSKKPLRGPYGQMLEAEMNKAELPKLSKHEEEMQFLHELTAPLGTRGNTNSSRTSLVSNGSSIGLPEFRNTSRTRQPNRSFDENAFKSNRLEAPNEKSSSFRLSPKRKVSANIPYSAPNPETSDSHGLGPFHQRTTSSPSKLEGLSPAPSPRSSGEGKKSRQQSQELLAELLRGSSEALSNSSKFDNVILCIQQFNDTRTHVIVELYDNERSYVESLDILVKKYLYPLKSPENAGLVDTFLVDEIFYQVPAILAVHEVFLEELRKRLEQWDVHQKIGDIFLSVFAKPSVMETYMSFINNWKKAKEIIKSASSQRPAFARFLDNMARDHKGKLSLDNLLIKPVQKFPRYEMLIQRILKHTDLTHPDHQLLLDAQREIHDLLVKINCTERESLELEQQQQTLRELETLIEGLTNLMSAERTFLRHDMVAMPTGQGTTKERSLFLFTDLLLITSMKRRTGTIKKPVASCPNNLTGVLESYKYKLLMRIALGDIEILKAFDESLRRTMREVEALGGDIGTLTQMSELASSLHSPHAGLDDALRDLLHHLTKQLADRQATDSRLCHLQMSLNTPSGMENLMCIFPKPDRRTSFEEAFTDAKHKLALSDEKRPTPEFLSPVPIRKTRAGLQFTCAAPTLPASANTSRDVWVCNSDGYVGQVCVLTLNPKPQVTSCNGVCNARILCVACVPAAPAHAPVTRQLTLDIGSSSIHSSFSNASVKPGISISDADDGLKNIRLDSSSSSEEEDDGSSTSDNQERDSTHGDLSKGDSTSLHASVKGTQSTSLSCSLAPSHTKSASTPHTSGQSMGIHPVIKSNSNPAVDKQAMGICSGTLSSPASRQSSEDSATGSLQATMWLGTEDGCIHVYNCNDNIRLKKNKVKLQHTSAVHCIVYVEQKVFVSLGNGDLVVYVRDGDGTWVENKSIVVGTSSCPVTKMVLSTNKLWCAQHTNIKVINTQTIQIEDSFQVGSDTLKPVSHMAIWGWGVWIALHNTALLKCFHAQTRHALTELNITQAVTKMLASSDDIIRQHKAACLRVTSLLACKEMLWVGTSAGVLLTASLAHMQQPNGQIVAPQLTGIPHGHTGHVRFLTVVETSWLNTIAPKLAPQPKGKAANRRAQHAATAIKSADANTKDLLVISGGDGYENFRNNSITEDAGREDSTNHLLLWKI